MKTVLHKNTCFWKFTSSLGDVRSGDSDAAQGIYFDMVRMVTLDLGSNFSLGKYIDSVRRMIALKSLLMSMVVKLDLDSNFR